MNRISTLLARGTVALANAATKLQTLQVRLLAREDKDGMEHMEGYGLTARAHPGAEVLAGFLGGDRSHGVVLVVADRRYRVTGLASGEVCLYDDIGHQVLLGRDGIVIKGGGQPVLITDTPTVRIEADIDATGEIRDRCDSGGRTMADMRDTYNGHTHPENDSGGPTDSPNQEM